MMQASVETGSGHAVIRVTFSPGHPGLTRFTIYPGLTRIGSREKRNCSFDDVETYKCDPVCEKGSYSLSNCIYMVTHNLTGEYGTSLQFGHSSTLTWQ